MKEKIRKLIAAELLTVGYVPRVVLHHAVRILLVVSLFAVCVLSARPAEAAPVIQLMTPQSGPVGTLVAIVGSGFGASQGTSTVMFNGTPVTWVSWSATSLQVQVPAGATSGSVVITVGGKASNTKSFTVTPSPIITSLSPISGPLGATIVITGSNFTAGGTQSPQVVFNPELFASPISSTNTSITVSVPAGASTGDLLVSVGGGNSNSVLFTVTSSDPSISSLSPTAGVVGTAVTINGTNFGSPQGTSTVTFNGTTGIPSSWSATSINVPIPTGATTGNVLVTVGGVASNPYGFGVGTAAPNITSISPASGAVATSVTIKGTGFGSTQGANTVSFNGVSGVPTSWSATQIKVPVPATATTGSVVVTASGTVSNGVNFTIPGTGPSVTSLSPSSGPVGASVTIAGTNFGTTQGASTVTFNGTPVTATGWSPTSIGTTVPSGATSGNLVVTVSGTASSGLNFTVVPSITSLSPTSGAGGTSVTINGNSFGSSQGTSIVTFNGTAATPTTWGTSSIIVPVPAGAATGNVVVTVGGVASSGVNFIVTTGTPPTITLSASPAPNASAWNNSNVTVTATCQAGSSPVTNCPAPQTISTEGANQVVSLTATDTNGLTATASVTLNIEKAPPALTGTSPADQSVLSSGTGVITGEVIPSLTGVTGVTCNGTAASFGSGGFSCNFSFNPGVNLVIVVASDVAGNTAGIRLHLIYSAPLPAPVSLQITPATANVLTGSTQQFTAVDQLGQARTDASWTVDNTNIATISVDSSPILTGLAAGTVTLTASLGSVSTQVQVNILTGTSLPVGTALWTAPSIPGYTLSQIFQAVPTAASTPDLIGVYQDNSSNLLVVGFTGDGQQLWQSSFSSSQLSLAEAIPDNLGGLVIFGSGTVVDIDGQSGQQVWQTNINYAGQPAAAPDGGTYIYEQTTDTPPALALVKLDPQSGQLIQLTTVPYGTENLICNGIVYPPLAYLFPEVSNNPVVDGQGNVFFESSSLTDTSTCPSTESRSETGSVIKIAPDGVVSTFPLFIYSQSCSGPGECLFGSDSTQAIVPDGQGGAFALWNQFPPGENDGGLTAPSFINNTRTGTTYQNPLSGGGLFPTTIILGENGNLIESHGTTVEAFGARSGSVLWTYQPQQGVDSIWAAEGGGVTVIDQQMNQIPLDVNGNPGAVAAGIGSTNPRALGYWASTNGGVPSLIAGSPFEIGASPWPGPNGGLSSNGKSPNLVVATFLASTPGFDSRFGTEPDARSDLATQIPKTLVDQRIYSNTIEPPLAKVPTFIAENDRNPMDVLGFIGHSRLITVDNSQGRESVGLIFVDNDLLRTPDCSQTGVSNGICYFLDDIRSKPDGTPAFNPPCLPGSYTNTAGLLVSDVQIVSNDGSVSYCFGLPLRLGGTIAQTSRAIYTSAKIVFVAACDSGNVFTDWWNLYLNFMPNGGALVVPDAAAMASLPTNHGLSLDPGNIDLEQGAVAWERLVNSLAVGKTIQNAVNDANAAVAAYYATITSWQGGIPLAQVVFKVEGNSNVCPKCPQQ